MFECWKDGTICNIVDIWFSSFQHFRHRHRVKKVEPLLRVCGMAHCTWLSFDTKHEGNFIVGRPTNYGWAARSLVIFVLPSWTFPWLWRPALRMPQHIVLAMWHVTRSFCSNLVNQRIGSKFSFYWSTKERFRCKSKLSILLRLKWSSLISFCCKKRPFTL